ncbi:MAG: response regulator [Deltaproteobacteria bacterium]|nr:response regulator [Deltaproteobacteria bacterium]
MYTLTRRFLIVDDQAIIRSFLKDLFLHYDMKCEEAANGREAIEKWEQEDFNAILMDLEMPEMDGLQAARIIRQKEKEAQRPYTPIFAISGTAVLDPEEHCRKAGMDGFIAKPVVISKLLECVMPLAS